MNRYGYFYKDFGSFEVIYIDISQNPSIISYKCKF